MGGERPTATDDGPTFATEVLAAEVRSRRIQIRPWRWPDKVLFVVLLVLAVGNLVVNSLFFLIK